MNSRVWGIYIINRFWSIIILWSRFKLFCNFLFDFLWKNVADVHKWLQICTKIDSSKVFAHKLYYSHPRNTFYNILRESMHFYNCCQIICSRDSHQNLNIYFFSCVHHKIHRSFLKFCDSVNMIDIDMKICRILLKPIEKLCVKF